MVREKVQEFIQQIMEEEVTELLGREKSERRSAVDAAAGVKGIITIRTALLKYCELDTLAMVMLYEGLKDLAESGGEAA